MYFVGKIALCREKVDFLGGKKRDHKFLLQLEKQEKKGFKDLANILSQLPKPAQGSVRSISVADAIEAGFLPAVDEDQANMFTPSELRLYRHAQDHTLNWDIPGYPIFF